MKKETWTLPDGSEIQVEEDAGTTWTDWGSGALWETSDPELIENLERTALPGESVEEQLSRMVEDRLNEMRNRPAWEQDPDRWKHNETGEG